VSEEQTGQTPAPQPLFQAILGDGCANPGRSNLRLICRAINGDWPMPEEKRAALVEHLVRVLAFDGGHGHAANKLAAIRCVLAAALADLRAEEARARRKARRPAGRKSQAAGFMAGFRGLGAG
jgi:hypothetical protein